MGGVDSHLQFMKFESLSYYPVSSHGQRRERACHHYRDGYFCAHILVKYIGRLRNVSIAFECWPFDNNEMQGMEKERNRKLIF